MGLGPAGASPVGRAEVGGRRCLAATCGRSSPSARTALEAVKDHLVDEFTASHGRAPTTAEVLRLRQEATLSTRPDKHVKPLRELIDGWRAAPPGSSATDPEQWVADLANHRRGTATGDRSRAGRLDEVAADALAKVAAKRSTFTRANVMAEVLRELQGVRFAAPADRARARRARHRASTARCRHAHSARGRDRP